MTIQYTYIHILYTHLIFLIKTHSQQITVFNNARSDRQCASVMNRLPDSIHCRSTKIQSDSDLHFLSICLLPVPHEDMQIAILN